jgi:branched-chain amino acid transport system substrate-binding protein
MMRERTRLGWRPLLAAFCLGVAFGCSPPAEAPATTTPGKTEPTTGATTGKRPAPTAEGNAATGETIKIGVIGSLTGDQKPWGEDSIEGARIAVDEFNEAGGLNGKRVELLIGDSASKAEQAKTVAEKLISDGAIAIVGEVASGHTIQIAKTAFLKGVPVVAIGATKTDLTDEGTHVVRVCYTDDFQGPVMAKFAYDELGLRNIGIMTDNKQPYSQYLSESFRKSFEGLGGKVAQEVTYESGQTQFSSQITELKAKGPDGVFLSGYFTEVGPIAQQIRQAGLNNIPLLGGDGWDSPQLLVSGGDAIIGSFFCNHYNNKETRPEVAEFLAKWARKFNGNEPGTTMGALGYDAMKLTLDALKGAEAPNSKSLIATLNEVENFKGVSGDITLKGMNGNPAKRALVVEVRPQSEGFQVFRRAYEAGEVQ